MIKKIIKVFIFLFLLCCITDSFSESKVELSLEDSNLHLGDQILLTVEIETNNTGSVDLLEIEGIDNFKRVNQSSSNQISILNGERFSKFQLRITLESHKEGQYIIGPVTVNIGGSQFKSNTLDISIKKKSIFSDSDDIKPIKSIFSDYFYFFFFQFVIIVILAAIFIYLNFLKRGKAIESAGINQVEVFDRKDKIGKLRNELTHLLNSAEIMNKSEFFEQINSCFRNYFSILGFFETETYTLKEIKKLNLDENIASLFEQSYINEFSNKKDTPKTRKSIINSFLEIIK